MIGFQKSFVVDSKGLSGGLAFLWRDDVDAELETYTSNHISWMVNIKDAGITAIIPGFYGNPDASKRKGSWDLVRALKPQEDTAWLCLGNFNEIMH